MFLLKLILVPCFILLVTFAGYRWGTRASGILGGMPVVAGPIVVLLALEQGQHFAMVAANTAIISVIPLLIFGIVYCWVCLKCDWYISLFFAVLSWLIIANLFLIFTIKAEIAILLTFSMLLISPYLLPSVMPVSNPIKKGKDLIWRILAGAALTVVITQSALFLGERWSGMLAVFPIIGSVLAIFTHITQGNEYVTLLYRGMMRGLYSLAIFFYVLAIGWNLSSFWLVIIGAILSAILVQGLLQLTRLSQLKLKLRSE